MVMFFPLSFTLPSTVLGSLFVFFKRVQLLNCTGADPGFFLGGVALVSCSTSTPINHIVFFLKNTSCIRKPQVMSGGGGTPCTLPLDPPLLYHDGDTFFNQLGGRRLTTTVV